jgi:peptide chain release factor 1
MLSTKKSTSCPSWSRKYSACVRPERATRARVGRERRLIAHRGGNAAEQRRHFRAGLGEAEDIVHEKQHVLALVAEIFGDGEAGQPDPGARTRRLVHLAVDQRAFRAGGRAVVLARVLVHAGLDELVIEVVALARALADPGEHRIAAVRLGDVVDEFLDDHGLADAGAAEQADLAALGVRRKQVHDLDPGN